MSTSWILSSKSHTSEQSVVRREQLLRPACRTKKSQSDTGARLARMLKEVIQGFGIGSQVCSIPLTLYRGRDTYCLPGRSVPLGAITQATTTP